MLVDEGSGMLEIWGQASRCLSSIADRFSFMPCPLSQRRDTSTLRLRFRLWADIVLSLVSEPYLRLLTNSAAHTGIGLISLLIAELERNPHSPYLNPESPLINFLSCTADSAPGMPSDLKKAVRKVEHSLAANSGKVNKAALRRVQDWWVHGSYKDGVLEEGVGRAMVSTTQAVDIINGGIKVNALVRSLIKYKMLVSETPVLMILARSSHSSCESPYQPRFIRL